MKRDEAPNRRPGAETAAETAELRKHLGEEGPENCGKTAEELRKDSLSTVSSLSSLSSLSPCPPAGPAPLPGPAPAPSLVRFERPARREVTPAAPPQPGGGLALPAAGPYRAARYGFTRNWCVLHGAELVAVVTYRKGAAELVRRLNSSAGAGVAA